MSDDYKDAVTSDGPVVYYRLDQLGFGADGETVPDLSGNGLDATLAFTNNNTFQSAWGHESPIETDPVSREFWGWTNASIFGFAINGVSRIACLSDSSMQPSPKDFTVEEWLRPMADVPAAGDFAMVSKQGTGGVILTNSGSGTHIGGF